MIANKSILDQRLRLCRSCNKYLRSVGMCKVCNCFIHIKARLSACECPAGKWPSVDKEDKLIKKFRKNKDLSN